MAWLCQDESPEDGDVIAMMVMLYLKMGDLPAKNGKFDKEQIWTHAMSQEMSRVDLSHP